MIACRHESMDHQIHACMYTCKSVDRLDSQELVDAAPVPGAPNLTPYGQNAHRAEEAIQPTKTGETGSHNPGSMAGAADKGPWPGSTEGDEVGALSLPSPIPRASSDGTWRCRPISIPMTTPPQRLGALPLVRHPHQPAACHGGFWPVMHASHLACLSRYMPSCLHARMLSCIHAFMKDSKTRYGRLHPHSVD